MLIQYDPSNIVCLIDGVKVGRVERGGINILINASIESLMGGIGDRIRENQTFNVVIHDEDRSESFTIEYARIRITGMFWAVGYARLEAKNAVDKWEGEK